MSYLNNPCKTTVYDPSKPNLLSPAAGTRSLDVGVETLNLTRYLGFRVAVKIMDFVFSGAG